MLRKLNFTERTKVPRANVRVTLRREADGVLAFDPTLSFDGVTAPSHARVFIEAYHRTSFMRFDCGSVNALSIPSDRRLTDIDGTSVRFRIKIVGASDNLRRIIAVADDIRVTEKAPEQAGRTPLLPVQFTDSLGEQAWRVTFEADSPVLELNNRINGIDKLAKEDSLFFALVYPAAVRVILTQILLVDQHEAFEDGDEWWSLWMRWAARYATTPLPADIDEAPLWIEDVVSAFSSRHKLVDQINATKGAGA
jgi:hypothetical protein